MGSGLLPKRPNGVNPGFILDGSSPQADKDGFYPFSANPQEENPARGYIVSANFQPVSPTGMEIPGYYNLADRGQQLEHQLSDKSVKWDIDASQKLQLSTTTAYGPRLLAPLLPVLREVVSDPAELKLVEQLAQWPGDYPLQSTSATLFNQLLFELTEAAFHEKLGDSLFDTLLTTRVIDAALPRLAADADSPWWDNRLTPNKETRADTLKLAWRASIAHLKKTLGEDPAQWLWGAAHTLTHGHPLGTQKPLDRIFNVGPFAAPGRHEVPNNQTLEDRPGAVAGDLRPLDPAHHRLRRPGPQPDHQPGRTKRRALRHPLPRPGRGVHRGRLSASALQRRRSQRPTPAAPETAAGDGGPCASCSPCTGHSLLRRPRSCAQTIAENSGETAAASPRGGG